MRRTFPAVALEIRIEVAVAGYFQFEFSETRVRKCLSFKVSRHSFVSLNQQCARELHSFIFFWRKSLET